MPENETLESNPVAYQIGAHAGSDHAALFTKRILKSRKRSVRDATGVYKVAPTLQTIYKKL